MNRIEENDYCRELDPALFDAPSLCEFLVSLPGKSEDIRLILSEKLQISHIVQKLSNILKMPADRITLHDIYGVEISIESTPLSTFRRIFSSSTDRSSSCTKGHH